MKPAFLLNAARQLISCLLNKDETRDCSGITVGTMLATTREVDLDYEGVLPAGSKGWVEYIDPENGEIEVLLEGAPLSPQGHWGNLMVLKPFHTEDIITALVAVPMQSEVPLAPHTTLPDFVSDKVDMTLRCVVNTMAAG